MQIQGVHEILFFFLESLAPLPCQHSAAIGLKKKYQPIGFTVHKHCVESLEGILQQGEEREGLQ